MRIQTSILCLLLSSPLVAADTYRWVDKDGSVHYSDQAFPGAERITLGSSPAPGSVAPRPQGPTRPAAGPARPFAYDSCAITSPNQDQVFFNTTSVSASLNVLPSLQSGHFINMQINGRGVPEWPASASSYLLQNLFRGSHTLLVTIKDGTGRTLCTSPAVTFHIRQPSMLTPGAKAAPRS